MKISIVLEALTGTFETDIKRASKEAEKAAREMRANFVEAGKVIGAAAAAAVTALAGLTGKAIASADALDEMSQRVGVSAKELSTLNYAAERGALDLGTFESAMVKLTKAASDTARGTGEAQAGFEALGISVKNADGTLKSSDQLLKEVATEFAGLEDGANKTALAVNLFGRAGAQMIPFLNQGAEGIAAVQEEARALGLEIENTTAALAGEFNDRLGDLRSLATGLGNDLARELLPALTELATLAVENGKAMRGAGGGATVLADGLKVVIAVAYTVKAAIEALVATIAGYVDVTIAAAKVAGSIADTLNPASQVMKLFGRETVSVVDAVGNFKDTVVAANDAARSGIDDAIGGLTDAYTALFAPTVAAAGAIEDTGEASRAAAPALAATGEAADKAKPKADGLAQAMKRLAQEQERAVDATLALVDEFDTQQQATDQLLDGMRFEISLLGLSNEAREEAILLRQLGANATAEETEELLRNLAVLRDGAAIREAAEAFESIWLNAADSVGDALTTALFDGADAGADAIKDVMKQLARDLVRFWIQQKIIIPLQQQLVGGPAGMAGAAGGGGGFLSSLLGRSVGGSGSTFGSLLQGAGTGYAVSGNWQGAALGTLGSYIGTAIAGPIGAIVGSVLGGLVGSLFGDDPKPRLRINSSGAGIGNIGTRGTTALGTLAFNADDLEDTRGTERQLLEAIQALDQGFVTLVNTFDLGQTQLDALRDAASRWSIDLRNSAITGEAVLGSRFGALLDTFDEHIVSFVGSAGTLEERMGRLTEALFIDAAAATGELVGDFDQLVELLDQFGREGEAVDATYGRLLQSTRLLEDALGMMGQNLDLSREAFVAFAAEIADAAGGLEQATALWSNYFETFYSEQERAELLVARASQQAAEQFADIGLAVEDFMGSTGLADFRALFERELPNLTAEQVVQWLEAANALGFFGEASAALAEILARAAEEAGAATAAFTALASAVKPEGPGGLDFGNINPGLPDPFDPNAPYVPPPAGPVLTTGMPWWMSPGARLPDGSIVPDTGMGADLDREIDRRYERELDWLRRLADLQDSLLLDEQLTTLTPAQRLAEIERQYQTAFTGALGGDEAAREIYDELARQFADIGRGFFGSSSGYDEIFARILADIGTLRAASPATNAASVVNTALTNSTPPPAAAAQGDQIAALRADFAAAMDQLVTIGERQVQLETRIANATEVTAQNTGAPLFQQRTIG